MHYQHKCRQLLSIEVIYILRFKRNRMRIQGYQDLYNVEASGYNDISHFSIYTPACINHCTLHSKWFTTTNIIITLYTSHFNVYCRSIIRSSTIENRLRIPQRIKALWCGRKSLFVPNRHKKEYLTNSLHPLLHHGDTLVTFYERAPCDRCRARTQVLSSSIETGALFFITTQRRRRVLYTATRSQYWKHLLQQEILCF